MGALNSVRRVTLSLALDAALRDAAVEFFIPSNRWDSAGPKQRRVGGGFDIVATAAHVHPFFGARANAAIRVLLPCGCRLPRLTGGSCSLAHRERAFVAQRFCVMCKGSISSQLSSRKLSGCNSARSRQRPACEALPVLRNFPPSGGAGTGLVRWRHKRSRYARANGAGPVGLNVQRQTDKLFSVAPAVGVGGQFAYANGMLLRPFARAGFGCSARTN